MSQIDPPSPSQQPSTSTAPSATPPTPPTQASEVSGVPNLTAEEVEKGKLFALLSYGCNFINIPFWIVPLFMRDNRFSLYHAKQCLTLFVFVLPAAVISGILTSVLIGCFMLPVVLICNIAFMIIGMMNVSKNIAKPLPYIGKYGEKWFASIDFKPAGAGPSAPPPSAS